MGTLETESIPVTRTLPLDSLWSGMSFYKSFYECSPLPMGVGESLVCSFFFNIKVRAYPEDMLNLECNEAAAKFFSRKPHEAKNQFSCAMGAPKDCVLMWLKNYWDSVKLGHPVSFEYTTTCHEDDIVR